MNQDIPSFSLNEKLVIITGASSGIGRQCSISCSNMGATVVLMGRDMIRLNETLKLLNEPEKHLLYSVEINDYENVSNVVRDTVSKKGHINGLIHCAGISTTLPLSATYPQKMDLFFQTNVIGAVNLTRLVTRQDSFSEIGGSIVFISSVMGIVGEKGKTLYSMTKGALLAAVKSMAVELSVKNIRVNAISPGVIESPMSKNAVYSRNEESLNKIKSLHPLGLGQPEDVANACIFLLSDAARWITGTNLIVDGGYLAR